MGSVDRLGRPLVRVGLKDTNDDFLALVDTGFNGDLMMSDTTAGSLKVSLSNAIVCVELGNGQLENVRNGALDIVWLGAERRARVLVCPTWGSPASDAPIALLGTSLLRPHLLLVDFSADTLEIESQE